VDRANHHLGHTILELLAEDWTAPVLRELRGGPLRPSELGQRLPRAPHSALMRRLTALHCRGIVSHERHPGLPPRAHYALTTRGRPLLRVLDAAERWERDGPRAGDRRAHALRLLADHRNRELLVALAAGPASLKGLEKRLPCSSSTLQRCLARLLAAGLIARRAQETDRMYEVTDRTPELAGIWAACAAWEWRPDQSWLPMPTIEIATILRLIAPGGGPSP
jgi:DNA-binding HxlR family transcriptional regulator